MLFARVVGSGSPTVVLLHGLGADEEDLLPLTEDLGPGTYHFLRAPLVNDFGGYSWYRIDFETGVIRYSAEDALASRDAVIEYLEEVKGTVVLGGFSQGAIISTGVALARPDLVSGLILWSGRLNHEFVPEESAQVYTPVLQQHGTFDPVLPITMGRELAEFWSRTTSRHTYQEFPMAHQISGVSLEQTRRWLGELVKGADDLDHR